eukprot:496816_1
MSVDFQLLKHTPDQTKYAVSGYIRRSQSVLSNKPYFNINVDIICNTCIMYYWIREYFTKHGKHIILDAMKHIVTWEVDAFQTVYGNINVCYDKKNSFNLYKWTLKILHKDMSRNFYMAIGLEASNKSNTERIYTNTHCPHYAYKSCKQKSSKESSYVSYGDGYTMGDIIIMECNINKRTLRYFVNDNDQKNAFTDMDFTEQKVYHLAVYGHDKDCSIQLIDFEQNQQTH